MSIGFDYGTVNRSMAVVRDGRPRLLKMENNSASLPSVLCVPTRKTISEWLYRHYDIPTTDDKTQALLHRVMHYNREEDIDASANSAQFGLTSLGLYIEDPEEVYFVKPSELFLDTSGLKPQQVTLSEDLVCVIMLHIRNQAQSQLSEAITQAVIGRLINFQGLGGDDTNAQAQGILERAIRRTGFQNVILQYEPITTGLDYETILQKKECALMVDIGGGTTDCSLLLTGPQWHQCVDRENGLLRHNGCRVDGDDLDIALAFRHPMPPLGMGGEAEKGTTLPILPWRNAAITSDIPVQNNSYGSANGRLLNDLVHDAKEVDRVAFLLKAWHERLSYRSVCNTEESKTALSNQTIVAMAIPFINDALATDTSQRELEVMLNQPLARILEQVRLALDNAQEGPDAIYLIDGSVRSPLIKKALVQQLSGIPIASSDDFGSVTAGLARWTDVVFRQIIRISKSVHIGIILAVAYFQE